MKRSYVAVATMLAAAPLAAQEPEPIGGVKLTGFVEVSYAYSSRRAGDTAIVGRLYDRLQNRFMLNALALVLDNPHDPAKYSAGFHGELLFGQNASVIKSGGFNFSEHGDIPHLYVTLNIPTTSGNGVQLKAGRIPTLLGLEVIKSIVNPNWSVGNQFVYVENFTALGLSVETKFSPHVDAQLRIVNGWDQVSDNNHRKSLMGRVGIYPDGRTSLGIVGYWGPEQPDDDTAGPLRRGSADLAEAGQGVALDTGRLWPGASQRRPA